MNKYLLYAQMPVVSFRQLSEVCTLSRIAPSKGEEEGAQAIVVSASARLAKTCLYDMMFFNLVSDLIRQQR